mgnify:CR=1 FL=1
MIEPILYLLLGAVIGVIYMIILFEINGKINDR